MSEYHLRKTLLNLYLIFTLTIVGFTGILVFEGVVDEGGAEAATIIVDSNGQGDYTKIQEAIDNASDGDTVYVWAGTYYENVIINKSINLLGNGTEKTIVNGSNKNDVIILTAVNVNISNVSIIGSEKQRSGIKIQSSKNCYIKNINCTNNNFGIFIKDSQFINVSQSILYKNLDSGILLFNSNNCTLMNNEGINNHIGIRLANSDNVFIEKNIIINSSYYDGLYLMESNSNIIKNNILNFNNDHGIHLDDSNFNYIFNNICENNFDYGIYIEGSLNNEIINNSCSLNEDGINLQGSNENVIKNNSCNSNIRGIYLDASDLNKLNSNICLLNILGLHIVYFSEYNKVEFNSFSDNYRYGIYLIYDSDNNKIINNNISNNSIGGIHIENDCNGNWIYFNNFIANNIQVTDNGTNNWYNNSLEGNYWSDYSGLDNGAGDRVIGDGIGDTEVPHHGLDYYPFTKHNGWLYPGVPIIQPIRIINQNGNYILKWNSTVRTINYILVEDKFETFQSPSIIYSGQNISFNFINISNNTYFYRVIAYYNDNFSSKSNVVNITVDWLPDIPKNFTVSSYSEGNILNLTWEPNLYDTKEYIIEYKNNTNQNWKFVQNILHPNHSFNHTNLTDGETYYYRIQAKDFNKQLSGFSQTILGTPLDIIAPSTPKELKMIKTENNSITLKWKPNTETDLMGYRIFRSKNIKPSDWGEPIYTSNKNETTFHDTGLEENTIYYYVISAFDEVPNNSSFSNIVNGKTLLGNYSPEINHSLEDFEIIEDIIDKTTINLHHWFKDENNDPLKFRYEGQSHINVTIDQKNGIVILMPKKDWNGVETLTFFANDSVFEISDTVTITVTPLNDPPESVKILTPQNNTIINDSTPIDLTVICFDPDIIYGDELTYTWSSNISGVIGTGDNLTDIYLDPGFHEITVNVTDLEKLSTLAIINIIVLPTSNTIINQTDLDEPDGGNENKSKFINSITTFLISTLIIVTIIILFLLILRKKKLISDENKNNEYQEQNIELKLGRQSIKTDGEVISGNKDDNDKKN